MSQPTVPQLEAKGYSRDRALLIVTVTNHAYANYERDGWDIVVECYSTEEIDKAIGHATSIPGAIRNVRQTFKLHHQRRKEAHSEIF